MLEIPFLKNFKIEGEVLDLSTLKRGHINETYVSIWKTPEGQRRYVHQLVNHYVFPDVPLLMHNIEIVTAHIRKKLASGEGIPGECTLTLVPTRTGDLFIQDNSGEYWRTYEYVEDTESYDFCTDPDQAYRAAQAFGRFERYLKDLSPALLKESIPHFQDSLFRFGQLKTSIKEDRSGRAKGAAPEIEFALAQEKLAKLFGNARESGKVPVRATHADPKVNNVLISKKSGLGTCIVDLDTCMPGTILYDFGDLSRTTTVPAAEDEQDFSKVMVNLELFDAVARGFLEEFGTGLSDEEKRLLPLAPQLLALTIGIRFLADHINGNKYFRVHHENHNLERARTQFQVVRTMQKASAEMERIVKRCVA